MEAFFMKQVRFFLIITLALGTVLPTYSASLKDLKKSFTAKVSRALSCLKGDKECSQAEIVASRAALVLLLAITTGGTIYAIRSRLAQGISQDTQTTQPTQLSPEQIELNQKFTSTKDISVMQELLSQGAQINAGHALHQAVRDNDIPRTTFLLANNADVNSFEFGETPLMTAAYQGFDDIVKLLLSSKKAKLNLQDDGGYTALHNAVSGGHNNNNPRYLNILTMLLQAGADPNIKNKRGNSPLWLTENSNKLMYDLLIKYGAQK